MYTNIGSKIRILADVLFTLLIILCTYVAIRGWLEGAELMDGVALISIGTLFSWLGMMLLSWFGQLIERQEEKTTLYKAWLNDLKKEA